MRGQFVQSQQIMKINLHLEAGHQASCHRAVTSYYIQRHLTIVEGLTE